MPVEQVTFDIPEEIAKRISSGEYSRFGGVVRDAAGHIVAHLEEIKPERVLPNVRIKPKLPDNELLGKVLDFVEDNKKNIVIAGAALIFAGGTALVVHKIKTGKRKKEVIKEIENNTQLNEIGLLVNSYDLALKKYYEAIQLKTTDYEVINNLRKEFEEIREGIRNGFLSFDVSKKELQSLATVIQGYGSELRKANGMLEIPNSEVKNLDFDQLIDLIITRLKEQEEVFEIQTSIDKYEKVLA